MRTDPFLRLRTLAFVLIILVAVQSSSAQTVGYEATMVEKQKDSARKRKIILSYDESEIRVIGKGRPSIELVIPFSKIKKADYTYSDRIQIAEGTGAAAFIILSSGYLFPGLMIGAMLLTSKKKTHWLGIDAAESSIVLELKKDDYRQILFDLKARGVNIEDLGKSEPALN